MYVRTLLIAALLAIATSSHAGTERDRWLTFLQKYAVQVGTDKVPTLVDAVGRAKAACVCTETGSLEHRPGFLVVAEGTEGLVATCAIPSFDLNGALEMAVGCWSFVPLAK
jgi:hypothetical protein